MTTVEPPGLARWIPIVVLAGLCGGFFAPLFAGFTFTTVPGHYEGVFPWRVLGSPLTDVPQSDQADLTYPWRRFIARELGRGVMPFWNPHSFGGQPFYANGSSGILYPPNLLTALLVTPDVAHDLVSVFHVLGSGLCMYLLMLEWRVGSAGALVAAVAWMLSAFNLAWLHLEVVAPMSTGLPLSLWLVSAALRRDHWGWTAGAVLALAAILISGHLLFGGVVYGVAMVYAATLSAGRILGLDRWARETTPRSRPAVTLGRLAALAIGPFLAGAAVLLPTVLYLASLGRSSIDYEAVHATIRVPYDTFTHLLFPPPLPLTQTTMHEMVYLGVLPPALALAGLWRRGPGAGFACLMGGGTFLLATDTVVLEWAYALFPPISFFSPLGRLLNVFNFAVAILAGVGFQALTGRLRPALRVAAATIVIAVTAWQLTSYGRAINPTFAPRDDRWLYPDAPLIQTLKAHGAQNGTAPGRIMPLRSSQQQGWTPPVLYAAQSMAFGIDSLSGWDSTLPGRAETVLRVVAGEDLPAVLARTYRRAFVTSFEIDRVRFALLPRLGVTTLVGPPGLSLDPAWRSRVAGPLQPSALYGGPDGEAFQLAGVSGGPWLVQDFAAVRSPDEAAARFLDPAFDHTRAVILEQEELASIEIPGPAGPHAGGGTVEVTEDGVNTLRARARSSSPGWVVLPNVWDRGWTARVNGVPTPVLRGNYAFQAVPVPAGESILELAYAPPGFGAGIVISLTSGAIAVIVILFSRTGQTWTASRVPRMLA